MQILLSVCLLLSAFGSLLCWRAWQAKKLQRADKATQRVPLILPSFDRDRATEALSMAISIPTVSHSNPQENDWDAFEAYARFLQERYPHIHQMAEREIVQGHALVYRIPGVKANAKAILWLSHQDVVPADNPEEWTYPPFSGEVHDGVLWGRGALDMKSHTIAMFEACEAFLASGHILQRDLYFALGYDEETGVLTSAVSMAAHLQKKGIELEYVLDESTNAFYDAALFDAQGTMACVGVSEKGFGNLRIEIRGEGGHASLPPRRTALMELVGTLKGMDGVVFPAKIAPPVSNMIDALLPHMPFRYRILYANRFVTRPFVMRRLSKHPQTNAWIRTTAALTTAEGSSQANVLPRHARALFNVRTAPWDVAQNIGRRIVALGRFQRMGDRVSVTSDLMDASPVSRLKGPAKDLVFDTVAECFPECIPVPSLMLGGTDAAHFCNICDCVYRFSPFRSYMMYGQHIHNTNERVDVADFHHAIEFFLTLLLRGNTL